MVTPSSSIEPSPAPERSRWRYLLPLVWAALGARIILAMARGESVRDDFLSLALVAFFMTTALLGSRLWLWLHDHWDRSAFGKRAELRQRRA